MIPFNRLMWAGQIAMIKPGRRKPDRKMKTAEVQKLRKRLGDLGCSPTDIADISVAARSGAVAKDVIGIVRKKLKGQAAKKARDARVKPKKIKPSGATGSPRR